MDTKTPEYPTSDLSPEHLAELAEAVKSVRGPYTHQTSGYYVPEPWLRSRDISLRETEQKCSRCGGLIPGCGCASSSQPTTGQPENTVSVIPGGQAATTSHSTSGKPSQTSGLALTYDQGKAPLAWLPWAAIKALSRVQLYGHKKYKDFNNYRKGMEVSRNLSCALRHIEEYLSGHDKDAESGESPLAHAMCRIAFVLQNLHDGTAVDDRYKK